jgi:hypothetical protein
MSTIDDSLMSPAAIAATAGAVLSLLFNYVPKLNTKFDTLTPDMQRGIMGLLILLTSIGMALWQCSDSSSSVMSSSICGDGMINWRALY